MTLRSEDLAWQVVDGGYVVLDLRSSRYLDVNGTGALLWPLLERGCEEDDLVAALTAAHDDVPEDVARRDVRAFVAELEARALLAPA